MNNDQRLALINKKGWEVAQKLQELKAKKNVSLTDFLKDDGDAKEPPEVRLRRYLDLINRSRTRIQSGSYGLCLGCAKPFLDAELDEMPWVELCRTCSAKQ